MKNTQRGSTLQQISLSVSSSLPFVTPALKGTAMPKTSCSSSTRDVRSELIVPLSSRTCLHVVPRSVSWTSTSDTIRCASAIRSSTKMITTAMSPTPLNGGSMSDTFKPVESSAMQNVLLVWLDVSIADPNHKDSQHTVNELRHVVSTIHKFVNSRECINFLMSIRNEKTFMIVSGSLGQSVVPLVHGIPHLNSIYVFCGDRARHEPWTKKWSKIKGVFTDIRPICDALKAAAEQCVHDSIPISFVPSPSETSRGKSDQLDQSFMYSQLLKEILLEIDFGKKSVKELANYSRTQFADSEKELNIIETFERKYHEYSPIWWYTYEGFLYPMLNRALRMMEVDIVIKMGFFIRDLHRQITKLHHKQFKTHHQVTPSFVVYRGQGLFRGEFDKLRKTAGGLISFNNFLSTTKKPTVAQIYARRALSDTDSVGIVFEMLINPSVSSTPFALIDKVSFFKGAEQEILFSMHTVFRIGEITRIDDQSNRLWTVQLTLTSDNDQQLNALTQRMREETRGSKGWFGLGQLLINLGQCEKAEHLYKVLLSETSKDTEKENIYHQLGWIRDNLGHYAEAIKYHEMSLEIGKKILPANHPNLATSYDNIGLVYSRLGDFEKAQLSHQRALQIYRVASPCNPSDLATSLNNLGLVYCKMGEYAEAERAHQEAFDVYKKVLPPNHPFLATCYNNIGSLHDKLFDHSKALWFYEKALDIYRKTLPPTHPDIAISHQNIGKALEKLCEYALALSSHEKALNIFTKTLSANHPHMATCYCSIALVYNNMNDGFSALTYYEKALAIREKVLPGNHRDLTASYNNLAEVYDRMKDYRRALSFYEKAHEINQRSLASNSPLLAASYHNLARTHVNMNEIRQALPLAERAVEIEQNALFFTHSDLQIYRRTLELVQQSLWLVRPRSLLYSYVSKRNKKSSIARTQRCWSTAPRNSWLLASRSPRHRRCCDRGRSSIQRKSHHQIEISERTN